MRSKKVGYFCVTCDKTFDFEGNIIPNKQSNMQPPQSSTTKMNPTDTITKPTAAVAKANAVSNIPYSGSIQTEKKAPVNPSATKKIDLRLQPDIFEMNINNHRGLSKLQIMIPSLIASFLIVKLINIAANKLATTKGEGNIDAIFGLLDAQKKIDQSQQELLKLFKRK